MSDIKLSSYRDIANVLTTELNSLANAARAISGAIDNTSNLDLWDDLELLAAFGVNPAAGSVVECYLVPSVDGTNYIDGDASTTPPGSCLVGAFPLRATTSAQRIAIRGVSIPPGLFKYLVINKSGQSMAASGNTLKRRSYRMQTA